MINLITGDDLRAIATNNTSVTYTITGLELTTVPVETYKRLAGPVQLTNGITTIYGPVAASTSTFIKTIHLQNTAGTSQTVSFYINGAVAANLLKTLVIPANGSAIFNQEGWTVYDSNGSIIFTSPTTLTGDVTGAGAGTIATTIANDAVTFAKMQNIPTDSLVGRDTAATGDPETILLNATLSMDGANNLQRAALTGDITAPAGSNATTLANTGPGVTGPIGSASVTPVITIDAKGRVTGLTSATITPAAISAVPTSRLINTTAPLTGGGDLSADRTLAVTTNPAGQTPVGVTRAINTTSPIQGGGDLSTDRTLNLASNGVTNAFLAQMATRTIKGNNTGGTANALDLTILQVQTMLDASVVNANEIGILTSNTGAQNVTAFNNWYATAPTFVTLYFPGLGFYDFSGELTMNRDIRLRLLGAGKGRSILRNTSITANLFNQTVAGFYLSFEELGFASTVVKTAGAAIISSGNNSLLDVRRCEFQNQFRSIHFSGSSGNIGVINEVVITSPSATAGGSQIKIDGAGINMMVQNTTINVTGADVIGLEINQVGAFQASCCDFIGGRNTLLVNATAVVSALYFGNCFFDQATFGSTVKFMGTGATSRTKFVQCGITNGGSSGLIACEIAGTGTGTGIPEAIDFLMCDFYNNGFAGTTTGLMITGVRGVDIRACRISGFTTGIDLTPYNANDVTNFNISENTIGPTENFAGNGTGIIVRAGSFIYGKSSIVYNDLSGNTTAPLNLTTATFTNSTLQLEGNLGLVAAAPGVAPATLLPITTITKAGSSIFIPANAPRPGTCVQITCTVTNAATIQTTTLHIKYGTADTNADASILTAALGAGTAVLGGARIVASFYFLSATTCLAQYSVYNNGATGFTSAAITNNSNTAPITIATNVNNFLGLYLASSVASIVTIRSVHYDVISQ